MKGVRLSRGSWVGFPEHTSQLNPDGSVKSGPLVLSVLFDVCPTWIALANKHVIDAKVAQQERQRLWGQASEEARDQLLERECERSMQAMVCAAIAWDALYSMVRGHAAIPIAMAEKWKNGRTARYIQVSETVRRAFHLNQEGSAALRANIKEIFRCRDRAVHPSGEMEPAVHHPELDVGVEWRFVFFRASNSEFAVSMATAMLWDLAHKAKPRNVKVLEYQDVLRRRLQLVLPHGRPIPRHPGDV